MFTAFSTFAFFVLSWSGLVFLKKEKQNDKKNEETKSKCVRTASNNIVVTFVTTANVCLNVM